MDINLGEEEITRASKIFDLPWEAENMAMDLFRKSANKKIFKFRDTRELIGSVMAIVCRQYSPRRFSEIAKVVGYEKIGKIRKTACIMVKEFNVKLKEVDITSFIVRYCSDLILPNDVRLKAEEIIKEAVKRGLTENRDAVGVAVAAIYIAAILRGEHRTQKEINDITGVSEATIRDKWKELAGELKIDVSL